MRSVEHHRSGWRRRLLSVLFAAGMLAGGFWATAAGAATVRGGPRPISTVERAAIVLASIYFTKGSSDWWDHLSADSPLRALGREAAAAEIGVRLGPTEGAKWRLQTPERADGRVAVFSIEYLSGFDETVLIEMVVEGKYLKVRDVRSRVDPQTGPGVRIGRLLPLRKALALGQKSEVESLLREVPKEPELVRTARLWEAQYRLEELDAPTAMAALELDAKEFPDATLPLAVLLRARLAFIRYDSLEMALAYEEAVRQGIDHDGLRFESLESQTLLGFFDEEGYQDLVEMGSRLAEVYYLLARTAKYHKEESAETLFRQAWHLRPVERHYFFQDPILARLTLEEDVLRWFDLEAPVEPRIGPPEKGRKPLGFPAGSQVLVSGNHLSVIFENEGEIDVPGGGVLAPEGTAWEDAGAGERRREEAALAELEEIVDAARSPTALAHPGLRRRMETAALALATRKRWADVVRLTEGIESQTDKAGVAFGQLRAVALSRLGYENEAIALLVRLAKTSTEGGRQDPSVLYQLAELAADHGRYDLAIRLIRKADSLSAWDQSSRIWQIELDRDLVKSHRVHRSPHFTVRYPPYYSKRYSEQIAGLLEQERRRLKKWIPVATEQVVEVWIFPTDDFRSAFGHNVLGLFDGRIRVPVKRTPGQKIEISDVLTHELAHAMITEYAGEDVPDWFQEGTAQFLEKARPKENPIPKLHASRRLLSISMVEAALQGYVPSELTAQAYEEAAWVIRYVNARFGLSGIRRLLDAFAAGHDTHEALTAAFNQPPAEFEKALWSWCDSGSARSLLAREEIELEKPAPRVGVNPELVERITEEITEHFDGMREWYRYYSAAVRPAKKSLRVVVGALRGDRSIDMLAACRQLEEEVAALNSDKKVFDCPQGDVQYNLEYAYKHFKNMAISCRKGHWSQVQAELHSAERSLHLVALVLQRYGLTP